MEKTRGYDEVQGFTGEFERIKLGGQVCKVVSAKEEESSNGNKMLVLAFDIAEGDNKDFYKRRFDADTRTDKKWSGVHRLMLLDKEGNTNKFFKGFITSIEASNKNFKWEWDETKLKGKLFGGIFGREEYEPGKFATKIRFIRSANGIENADIPEDKLLTSATNYTQTSVEEDDDLPF